MTNNGESCSEKQLFDHISNSSSLCNNGSVAVLSSHAEMVSELEKENARLVERCSILQRENRDYCAQLVTSSLVLTELSTNSLRLQTDSALSQTQRLVAAGVSPVVLEEVAQLKSELVELKDRNARLESELEQQYNCTAVTENDIPMLLEKLSEVTTEAAGYKADLAVQELSMQAAQMRIQHLHNELVNSRQEQARTAQRLTEVSTKAAAEAQQAAQMQAYLQTELATCLASLRLASYALDSIAAFEPDEVEPEHQAPAIQAGLTSPKDTPSSSAHLAAALSTPNTASTSAGAVEDNSTHTLPSPEPQPPSFSNPSTPVHGAPHHETNAMQLAPVAVAAIVGATAITESATTVGSPLPKPDVPLPKEDEASDIIGRTVAAAMAHALTADQIAATLTSSPPHKPATPDLFPATESVISYPPINPTPPTPADPLAMPAHTAAAAPRSLTAADTARPVTADVDASSPASTADVSGAVAVPHSAQVPDPTMPSVLSSGLPFALSRSAGPNDEDSDVASAVAAIDAVANVNIGLPAAKPDESAVGGESAVCDATTAVAGQPMAPPTPMPEAIAPPSAYGPTPPVTPAPPTAENSVADVAADESPVIPAATAGEVVTESAADTAAMVVAAEVSGAPASRLAAVAVDDESAAVLPDESAPTPVAAAHVPAVPESPAPAAHDSEPVADSPAASAVVAAASQPPAAAAADVAGMATPDESAAASTPAPEATSHLPEAPAAADNATDTAIVNNTAAVAEQAAAPEEASSEVKAITPATVASQMDAITPSTVAPPSVPSSSSEMHSSTDLQATLVAFSNTAEISPSSPSKASTAPLSMPAIAATQTTTTTTQQPATTSPIPTPTKPPTVPTPTPTTTTSAPKAPTPVAAAAVAVVPGSSTRAQPKPAQSQRVEPDPEDLLNHSAAMGCLPFLSHGNSSKRWSASQSMNHAEAASVKRSSSKIKSFFRSLSRKPSKRSEPAF